MGGDHLRSAAVLSRFINSAPGEVKTDDDDNFLITSSLYHVLEFWHYYIHFDGSPVGVEEEITTARGFE